MLQVSFYVEHLAINIKIYFQACAKKFTFHETTFNIIINYYFEVNH